MITVEMMTKNPLYIMHDEACITQGKRARVERKETHDEALEYYKKMFIAEHSVIEYVDFRVVDTECRGDVASHFTRHTKGSPRPEVQSNRPDWNGGTKRKALDKTIVMYTEKWNAWAWLHMCRLRLCTRASKVDRDWLRNVLSIMKNSGDPYFEALAFCSVPNCIYRSGCPELKGCGFSEKFFTNRNVILEIQDKYSEYNNFLLWENMNNIDLF